MKKIIKLNKIFWLFVSIPLFFACEDDDDGASPQVVASFAHTINEDTGKVTFINLSENADSYEWNFGDGSSSTLINPLKTYPTGNYTIILTATNTDGSSDTFEDTIFINVPEPVSVPFNFDEDNADYGDSTFGGASFAIVDNPDVSGTNDKASNVGAITNSGAEWEGVVFELGTPIDLSTEKTIKMNFWSDKEVNVLLKLEITESDFTQIEVTHSGSGWEELIFNFSGSKSYSKIVIFVDGGKATSGTFYIDDIVQMETEVLPCTAETEESFGATDFNWTFMTDPSAKIIQDNTTFEYADNPDPTSGSNNESCKVGKVVNSNQNPWDNMQIDLDSKLVFGMGANFTMKIYAPQSGYKVTLKLEDKTDSGIFKEVPSNESTTKTNEWEDLTFPFDAADSDKYDKIVIFFDLQTTNGNTYYFDDLKLNQGTGGGGTCTPETMQSLAGADFNLTFMADPTASIIEDGSDFEWVDNPDFDNAVNPSCKVGKITKLGNNPWDNNQIDLDAKLDFNANAGLKIKVWSARADTEVRVKLEEIGNPGNSTEKFLTTSVTSDWEELTFPFDPADSDKFDKIVVFFDLNANNTDTYYFDDLMLYASSGGGGGGGGTGSCPDPPSGELLSNGGFEANSGDGACWQFNPTGGTSEVSMEQANAGTYSAKLVTGKDQAPNIKMERFAPSISGGVSVEVSFKYRIATQLGTGSILQVLAFSELTGDATLHDFGVAADGATALDTWHTFTQTFTTDANVAEGISLLIQLTGSGNDGAGGVLYVDDVVVKQL